MQRTMPHRFSLGALRPHLLVLLLGLVHVSALIPNAQGQVIEGALNTSLPRVTAVNGRIEVGQIITVDVENLSNWSAGHDPRKLVPFLNGRALAGLYPEEVNLHQNRLLFHLRRTPESRKVWEMLFHEPVLTRQVSLSIGLENQSPFDSVFDSDSKLTVTIIPKTWGIVSLAATLAIFVLLVYLATHTNMLRSPGPCSATGRRRPYDVGRVQSAIWFFIVSTSYLGLWLITGDLDTITPSVLGLMGISAATVVGANLIATSGVDINEPTLTPGSSATSTSQGFLTDVLSDANGYSFHRFQMFCWTILLGLIFISSVYDNLAMPQFSASLLALMGVSSGTYLGFEMVGNKSPSTAFGDQVQGEQDYRRASGH